MRLYSHRPFAVFLTVFLVAALACGMLPDFLLLPCAVAALSAAALLFLWYIIRRARPAILLRISAGFLACFLALLPLLLYTRVALAPLTGRDGEEGTAKIRVERVSVSESYLTILYGTMTEWNGEPIRRAVCAEADFAVEIAPGDEMTGTAVLHPLSRDDAENAALFRAGNVAVLSFTEAGKTGEFTSLSLLLSRLRGFLSDRVAAAAPGESGNLYAALLLGEKDRVSPVTRAEFGRLGLSHMLALSGLHLSVVILLFFRLLRLFRAPGKFRAGVCLLLTVGYMVLTGCSPSIFRAGVMLIAVFLCFLAGKRHDAFTALLFSCALFCLFRPYDVYDVGLWLSAISTFAMLLPSEWRQTERTVLPDPPGERVHRPRLFSRFLSPMRGTLYASLAALIATLPIVAAVFGEVSLLSLPANLLFALPVAAALHFSLLGAVFSGSVPILSVVLQGFGEWFLGGVHRLSQIPHALLSLEDSWAKAIIFAMSAVLVAILLFCRNTKRPILITAGVSLSLLVVFFCGRAFTTAGDVDVTYVGDASGCYLLVTEQDCAVVYDATPATRALRESLAAALRQERCTEIGDFVLSAYTSRAPGELFALLSSYRIGCVHLPPVTNETDESRASALIKLLERYDVCYVTETAEATVALPDAALHMLPASYPKNGTAATAACVVTDERSVLFLSPAYSLDEYVLGHEKAAERIGSCGILIFGGRGSRSMNVYSAVSYGSLETVLFGNPQKVNTETLCYLLPEETEVLTQPGTVTFPIRR